MTISCAHPNRRPYNWLIYDLTDGWLERFKALYRGHVYDLGCGEMPYKEWLLTHAQRYTGVDWAASPHVLKADILADLNEPLPIESHVADVVLSISVMEHLREPMVFLNEAYRLLRGGGQIVLQVPFIWGVHEAPFDYYRYTEHGLHYMLGKAGFTEISVYPQSGFWTSSALRLNYQSRKLLRGPRWVRSVVGLLLRAAWAVDQRVAPRLDRIWKSESESVGYFVVALKP